MRKTVPELEHEAISRVAREYSQRGYNVSVQPGAAELPIALRQFQIDMIARSDAETVVIEVTSSNNLKKKPELSELASHVERLPKYRFELVTISTKTSDTQLAIDRSVICRRCDEAASLARSGLMEAALLLLWSAAEGTLRLMARQEGLAVLEKDSPLSVLRTVYASGLLPKEHYDLFLYIAQARNQVAHGFMSDALSRSSILSTVELIQKQWQCP